MPTGCLLHFQPLILADLWSQVHRTNLISPSSATCLVRGEGCNGTMDVAGTALTEPTTWSFEPAVKLHGLPPTDTRSLVRISKTHKRSFVRAQKRASITGHAWYRGQLLTSAHLGLPDPPKAITRPSKHQHSPYPVRDLRCRAHVMSWNCSGLTQAKLDDLCAWAHTLPLQLIVFQETRWDGSKEWMNPHWTCGGTPRQSTGILILVRKGFCDQSHIAWKSIVPGRLVHMRLFLSNRPLDLISVYQHTFRGTVANRRDRLDLLHCLDDLLRSLQSQRHPPNCWSHPL